MKKKEKKGIGNNLEKKDIFEKFPVKYQNLLFIGLLFLLLLGLNKETAIDGLSAQGTDVVQGIGKSNQLKEFRANSDEEPMWNPAIFGGMPKYNDISPKAYSVDTFLADLQGLFGNVFIYYFLAALGMYFLLRYFKMPPIVAFIGALMFVLIPHYKGLWMEGHMRKFRALMYIPWVIYAGKYFIDKRSLLSSALFALAFGIQVRTGHYQIIFYTALLIFAIGVYPFIKDLIEKNYSRFGKSTVLLLVALALGMAMSAQPLLLNKEYLPYSKRGKTTISLKKQEEAKKADEKDGVSMQYATQWSTHPLELTRWIIPHAYGGFAGEKYDGKDYPQLKGQQLPSYWGYMPFHTLFDYLGLATALLAILAIVMYRKNSFIVSLSSFALFMVILSFGRHFESFYALFYNYFPYFNKFRAPSMSVTVTYFVMTLLAAFGLKYLYDLKNVKSNFEQYKKVFYVIGGFAFVGLLVLIMSGSMEFMKEGENYNKQVTEMLKNIRRSYLTDDMLRYFILLAVCGGLIAAYLFDKIKFSVLAIVFAVVVAGDLINIQSKYNDEYNDLEKLENMYFGESRVDQAINKDKGLYRVFPVGQIMQDNRWAYYHQTIGGYTPIKMYTVEELVENCYYGYKDPTFPINVNVAKFMNVKYFITQQPVNRSDFQPIQIDQQNKLFAYKFTNSLDRAFFVGETEIISDEYKRLERINSVDFDPAKIAIVEEEFAEAISTPDSSYVKVVSYSPNLLEMEVYTDKQSLLVISEMDYPPAWKIFIDGEKVEKIYRTDHAIQSVIVKAGQHKVEVKCEPDSYFFYKNISVASVSIIYLVILASLVLAFKRKKELEA